MYDMKYNIQVDSDMHLCAGPIMAGGKGTCIVSIQRHYEKSRIESFGINFVCLKMY